MNVIKPCFEDKQLIVGVINGTCTVPLLFIIGYVIVQCSKSGSHLKCNNTRTIAELTA